MRARAASLFLISSLVAVAGCGKSTSSIDPSAAVGGSTGASTTALAVYDGTTTNLQTADSTRFGGRCGAGFGLPIGIPRGCPWDAASGWFVCTNDFGPDGIVRSHRYQFLDASNSPQPAYDSLTTASIRLESSESGSAMRNGRTTSLQSSRELTLSGLAGEETSRTLNGTGGSYRRDSTADAVTWTRSATTLSNIVIPAPFARDSWPLSGTVSTSLENSAGLSLTSLITFNGTRYVPMAVGDTTVTIDLARGRGGVGCAPPGGGPGPGGGRPPHGGPGPH